MSSILNKMAGLQKLFFFRPFVHSYVFVCKILSTFPHPFLVIIYQKSRVFSIVICVDYYLKTFSYLDLDCILKRKVLRFPFSTQ